jgi:hypothetical protein
MLSLHFFCVFIGTFAVLTIKIIISKFCIVHKFKKGTPQYKTHFLGFLTLFYAVLMGSLTKLILH